MQRSGSFSTSLIVYQKFLKNIFVEMQIQTWSFEHLKTIFHHVRGKHKQPFNFWYCVNNFYPWKYIIGKKVSTKLSTPGDFGNSTTFLTIDFKLILRFKSKKGNKIKLGRLARLDRPESEYHWKIQMRGCVIFPINILKLCQIKQPIGSKTIGDKVARNTGL